MLIEIDDKIVTDEIFSRKFVCDLSKCKGACCVEGDDGAPLEDDEIKIMEEIFPKVKPYMTKEGIAKVEKDGVFYLDRFNEPVTSLVEGGACAFVSYDPDGTTKCTIEQAYRNGDVDWKKPISCELYPIRAKKYESFTALNYEEIDICKPGCVLGEQLNIPVYQFLKAPLTRAYGDEFYESLKQVHKELEKQNEKDQ
ncbi:DUF3109 family protein [Brumimicrobium glaciale]|jgi:hypothetical protein|uniref:DUF3109 family protein n=1 Tax=Brumimicrobium glaciale TaxID=200475 RepID=A0A4Q4KSG9_9FLAO|nr:DUF3109 family protein [Brumimicrobium glaciale]RYM35995.1 DUF3109 family protein [Brumimicrobium glaciale]